MGPISLQKDDDLSPMLDADLLTEHQAKVINMSVRNKEVLLLGADGEIINGLEHANVIEGNYVSTEDVPEEEDCLPDIVSVTIPIEEEDEEEEEEITEDIKEEAKILLSKNGNTVRATISSLPSNSNSLLLLHACHDIELEGKNRSGILNVIQNKMMEC